MKLKLFLVCHLNPGAAIDSSGYGGYLTIAISMPRTPRSCHHGHCLYRHGAQTLHHGGPVTTSQPATVPHTTKLQTDIKNYNFDEKFPSRN